MLRHAERVSEDGQYKSILEKADNPEIVDYFRGLVAKSNHLTAAQVRRVIIQKFDRLTIDGAEVEWPPERTFRRWMRKFNIEKTEALRYLRDPDGWKNTYKSALGRADDGIDSPNALWEIDASPSDVMLVDGRYSIYMVIDVYTRRTLVHVAKTCSTQSALAAIRKAIVAWGMPQAIRMDNGSDFVSYQSLRVLEDLGIDVMRLAPGRPEGKPFVERVIGTFQRDFCAMLPGFTGHNVAQAQKLRAQKSFMVYQRADHLGCNIPRPTTSRFQRAGDGIVVVPAGARG